MSEREFAAAISPNFSGESTTGVIKSSVSMPSRFSSIIQTAASSPWFHDARSSGFRSAGRSFSRTPSSAGLILAAQPLVRANSVSLKQKSPLIYAALKCRTSAAAKILSTPSTLTIIAPCSVISLAIPRYFLSSSIIMTSFPKVAQFSR